MVTLLPFAEANKILEFYKANVSTFYKSRAANIKDMQRAIPSAG